MDAMKMLTVLCLFLIGVGIGRAIRKKEKVEEPIKKEIIILEPALGIVEETKQYYVVEESFHTYYVFKESYRVFHPHDCRCMKKKLKKIQ